MKLTLGSGTHYADGWVNIDLYAEDADVRGDCFALPFRAATFAQVYAGHVLEHLPYHALPRMLAEVRRVLRPRGRFVVVGPCIELAVWTNQPNWLMRDICRTVPAEPLPGHGHAWTATGPLTLAAVQVVFPKAKLIPASSVTKPEWPNPCLDDWQCAVVARP